MQQAIDILDEMIENVMTKPDDIRTDAQFAILDEAKSRIQSLPDNEWISVTDRLPEIDWEYIICDDIWDWYNEVYTCIFDTLHWFIVNTVWWQDFYPKVTHYQSLPNPPTL